MAHDSSPRSDPPTGCRYVTWVGAYLLGALTVADSAWFVPHARTCQQCRDEIVSLAGLPSLLFRASFAGGWPGSDG